ncbi:bifunctional 2',3'-cyclic nucleotide 2'-phosphodiesterase/3'-nucleotidase precursor protein [Paraliobacillus sp. PM-2]|uniref:InlB B-repeat-containing protein n=1 Tax=Paraliobacillus sp. PM-2 TaxID=1462524 RepID=UPI00061BF6B1|nr:InlB B-repeat-containing protein [Paraliobacillus sp. PM-2]CQR48448.1 bifunctional 2',3'-cyclic nucleotide 2'-phosphodiesterase/3'-nucleotidase precursor protein [Paraliobacillus sp. PM-2]
MKKITKFLLVSIILFIFSNIGGFADKALGAESNVITFNPDNGTQQKQVHLATNETLKEEQVPFSSLEKESYDFLGWYYGENNKYEVIFPFSTDQDITLTAKWGTHTSPNPVEKEGYRLIFNDEFNNDNGILDSGNWVDKYLSSWTKTPQHASPTYNLEDGVMNLQIKEETEPWAPEFDGQTVVSGFTTGNRNALHNWNGTNVVRNPVETEISHINQYGYYEIRSKGQAGSSRHSAWWLLGFEDRNDHSAEIDIFEILGNDATSVPRAFHNWNDGDAFNVKDSGDRFIDSNANFHDEWHTFGLDWQKGTGSGDFPDKLVFYIDGEEVGSKNVNIDYPMIQLFSLYEKRAGGWTGPWEWMPYPNSFNIDYVRVYKKLPDNQSELPKSELEITDIEDSTVTVQEGQAKLTQYTSGVNGEEGEVYTEPNLPNTLSYVDVTWNDGIVTQEFVKWDPITEEDLTKLNNGESITKEGTLPHVEKGSNVPNPTLHVEVTPAPPYSSENLGTENSQAELAKLFDGMLGDNSGLFYFENNHLPTDKEVNIMYDFTNEVTLNTISFTTNYGEDQGIKKFKLSTFDLNTNEWVVLDKEYSIPWTDAGKTEAGETIAVDVNSINTSKIKMIITDAGLTWNNKIAMREIAFNYDVNLKPLHDLIGTAKEVSNEDESYTPDSFAALQTAITNAESALEDIETVDDLNVAIDALQVALDNLVDSPIDVTPLEAVITTAEEISNNDGVYTADSFAALQAAIAKAKEALETIETEENLNTAIDELQAAINQLKKEPTTDDETSDDNQNVDDSQDGEDEQSNDQTGNESQEDNGNKLPNTATPIYNWIVVGIALLIVGLGTTLFAARRRN